MFNLLELRRKQEQDEANVVQWVNDATNAEILAVLEEIQKPHDNPRHELVSRMAQLGLAHAYLLAKENKP